MSFGAEPNGAAVELVGEIAAHFHEYGEWPNLDEMQRRLARQGRRVDVYRELAAIGTRLAHQWSGDTSRVALTVRGLATTETGRDDLALLVGVVRAFVEKYLGDEANPTVTLGDLASRLGLDELSTAKAVLLLDAFGHISGGGGESPGLGRYWVVSGRTIHFTEVDSVERLLAALDGLEAPWPGAKSTAVVAPAMAADEEAEGGHAFISYVREDGADVDRIQRFLEAAGIRVWRDTDSLWPGEDWRVRIRKAITDDSLVFLACFSENSAARAKSYQNEELVLAAEQFRLRTPDQPWLIPVRLSECELPSFDLGAGRTLDSLHRIDLFGPRGEENVARLTAAVLRIFADLGRPPAAPQPPPPDTEPVSIVAFVKKTLPDPIRQIELEDFVMGLASKAAKACGDEDSFPVRIDSLAEDVEGYRYVMSRVSEYWKAVSPLAVALAAGCAWGQPHHQAIWTRAVQSVASTARWTSGIELLVELRRFPLLPLVYAGGLTALYRGNFGSLKAVAVDPSFRLDNTRFPLIGGLHPWRAFINGDLVVTLLAVQADGDVVTDDLINEYRRGKGMRFTPVSDLLHRLLRPLTVNVIAGDDEYTETFDRLEVLLGVIAEDVKRVQAERQVPTEGAWFGSFTWRNRTPPRIEEEMFDEFRSGGNAWPPLAAGLFGGDRARAEAAFVSFAAGAAEARQRRH